MPGQPATGGDHHGVGHPTRPGGSQAQAHGREDEHVVALRDGDLSPLVVHRREGRAGGHQSPAVRPTDQVFGDGLRARGGIGEGEDQRAFRLASHGPDDGLRERTLDRGQTDEHPGVRLADHVGQARVDLPGFRPVSDPLGGLRIDFLLGAEVSPPGVEKTLAVYEKEFAPGLRLGEAVVLHGRQQVVGDADGRRACPEKDKVLLAELFARHSHPREDAGEHDGCRSLDVIVEGEQLVAVTLQQRAGVFGGEILPLQEVSLGELFLHRLHELIHEVEVGVARNPLVSPAEIFRVLEPLLVVGAHVQDHGQRVRGRDAADERVERKLADGDAQPADSLVAQAEDTLAVGDHRHRHIPLRAVAQNLRDLVALRIGDKQPARSPVDVGELLARLADGRRVDDGSHFLNVVEQEPVEKRLVGVLELT